MESPSASSTASEPGAHTHLRNHQPKDHGTLDTHPKPMHGITTPDGTFHRMVWTTTQIPPDPRHH